ncbi:MAG: serine hydrolase domain-containing protein [Chloroflexota bacterium]
MAAHNTTPTERILNLVDTIDAAFHTHASSHHIPGVAYGIVTGGQLIYIKSFGLRNTDDNTPVNNDTVFRIASMSKSFTAAAILQLRDKGLVQLDAPMQRYVPELAKLQYPTQDSAPITVRQLLSMSAGFPQDDPWADRQLYRDDASLTAIYQQDITFSSPPSTGFEYSNLGYMILGRIITNVSGQPYINYINEHLLQPLGMNSTGWNAHDFPAARVAQGYQWLDDGWVEEVLLPSGGDVAAFAGIFTTVNDLAIWVNWFLDAYPPRDDDVQGPLSRSSRREMQQIWQPASPEVIQSELGAPPKLSSNGYGYGLSIGRDGEHEIVRHGGGLPGFGSYMCWSPAHDTGVIALGNVTYAGYSRVGDKLLIDLIKKATLTPVNEAYRFVPNPTLIEAQAQVNHLLQAWDDAIADTLFADNFFLDRDRTHWQQDLAKLQADHGTLTQQGELQPENWLRGEWRMVGTHGFCDVWISLSPTIPPLVQEMEITSTLPLSEAMQAAADKLAVLTKRPTLRALDRIRSRDTNRLQLWDRVRLANLLCGPCVVQDVLAGDGTSESTVRFVGTKRNTKVKLTLNQRGKLTDFRFLPDA